MMSAIRSSVPAASNRSIGTIPARISPTHPLGAVIGTDWVNIRPRWSLRSPSRESTGFGSVAKETRQKLRKTPQVERVSQT